MPVCKYLYIYIYILSLPTPGQYIKDVMQQVCLTDCAIVLIVVIVDCRDGTQVGSSTKSSCAKRRRRRWRTFEVQKPQEHSRRSEDEGGSKGVEFEGSSCDLRKRGGTWSHRGGCG